MGTINTLRTRDTVNDEKASRIVHETVLKTILE